MVQTLIQSVKPHDLCIYIQLPHTQQQLCSACMLPYRAMHECVRCMHHHSTQKHVMCLLQLQLQLSVPVGYGTCRAKEGQGGEVVHRRHSGAVHRPEQGLCLHLKRSHQVITALPLAMWGAYSVQYQGNALSAGDSARVTYV